MKKIYFAIFIMAIGCTKKNVSSRMDATLTFNFPDGREYAASDYSTAKGGQYSIDGGLFTLNDPAAHARQTNLGAAGSNNFEYWFQGFMPARQYILSFSTTANPSVSGEGTSLFSLALNDTIYAGSRATITFNGSGPQVPLFDGSFQMSFLVDTVRYSGSAYAPHWNKPLTISGTFHQLLFIN